MNYEYPRKGNCKIKRYTNRQLKRHHCGPYVTLVAEIVYRIDNAVANTDEYVDHFIEQVESQGCCGTLSTYQSKDTCHWYFEVDSEKRLPFEQQLEILQKAVDNIVDHPEAHRIGYRFVDGYCDSHFYNVETKQWNTITVDIL